MKLKILITKNILEQSKNCLSSFDSMLGQNCAIGLAIFSLFGAKSWVGASSIRIYEKPMNSRDDFNDNLSLEVILLPQIAREFIYDFDSKDPEERVKMEPISFDIEISDKIVDMLGLTYIHQVVELQPQLELA